MQHDDTYLFDILNAAEIAVKYLEGKSFEEFNNDLQCQDAIIRRLEIIGEATNRISNSVKIRYSNLPWKKMTGMRNLLIHEYDDIDLKIVWDTVKNNLPELIIKLKEIIP